jgi:hypothetical protein
MKLLLPPAGGGEISLTRPFNTVFFYYNSFSISAELGILIPGLADFVTNGIVNFLGKP